MLGQTKVRWITKVSNNLKLESAPGYAVQLNEYETALSFIQLNPKIDIGLFVDLAEFPCFYQFLHDVIKKLFCFDLQNNFMITTCKNW